MKLLEGKLPNPPKTPTQNQIRSRHEGNRKRKVVRHGETGGVITVKAGRTELTYGEDYEILEDSYVNNIRKGTASVKIRGIHNYGGTKTVNFKIQAKKMESFSSIIKSILSMR